MQNDLDKRPEPTTASEWRIALKENPSDARLQRRFEQWRAADVENRQAWEEVSHLTQLMKRLEPEFEPTRQTPRQKRSAIRVLKTAEVARRRPFLGSAIAACLAFMVGVSLLGGTWADYETGTKELQVVTLADGSEVTLAPNSAINVAYEKGQRLVELVKGKALFDVTANKQRPFIVQAKQMDVTVLGTSFEVKNAHGSGPASVAVRHGKVRVAQKQSAQPETHILGAGEWTAFAENSDAVSGIRNVSRIGSWQNNLLLAQGNALEEVVAELDDYFTGVILVAGEQLGRQPVTGVYQLDDPEAALLAISVSHGAKIYRLSPWILIVSKG
ncbi:MAG: transmembrane sensor [Parvibaculaceae bacterium]|jgi:transmembrane sensor